MKPILFIVPEWFPLIGGMPVFSYGVMLGLSFIIGWYLTLYLSERDGVERRYAIGAMLTGIVLAMIGARGLHFVANPESFRGLSSLLEMDAGGLVAYGGYLGGLVGGAVYLRLFTPVGFFRFVDYAAPSFGLGLGLTRVGCYLYGCDFGQRADGGLAVRFAHWGKEALPWVGSRCSIDGGGGCGPLTYCSPSTLTCAATGSPAWALHRKLGYVGAGAELSEPVHAAQLYASINGFALFVLLLVLYRYRKFSGQVMLTFLGLYAITRFFLERVREDPERGWLWEVPAERAGVLEHLLVPQGVLADSGKVELLYIFSTSQFISLTLLLLVAAAFFWAWRRYTGKTAVTIGDLGVPVGPAAGAGDDASAS